jgi:hypothetical protein
MDTENEPRRCHDCACLEGELHEPGCDMERCPFCGGQLLTCDCCYDYLGLRDSRLYSEDTSYLPPDVYEHGLSEEQEAKWEVILNHKGLVPYIVYPFFCARCGELYPELFHVPDVEWKRNVDPGHRRDVLCRPCYDFIKTAVERTRLGVSQ